MSKGKYHDPKNYDSDSQHYQLLVATFFQGTIHKYSNVQKAFDVALDLAEALIDEENEDENG